MHENKDSRSDMFNIYGTRLPLVCVQVIRGIHLYQKGHTKYTLEDALHPSLPAWRCGHSSAVRLRAVDGDRWAPPRAAGIQLARSANS